MACSYAWPCSPNCWKRTTPARIAHNPLLLRSQSGKIMRTRRLLALACAGTLLAACGKSGDNTAPLAFVPADSPFVYANLEPTPAAVTAQWSTRMQQYWPAIFGMYEGMLERAKTPSDPAQAHALALARALVDTLKTHDTWDKLRELGLKPDMRIAIYGVGVVPVLRMELGDAA